ncbi:hypothetical protein C8Q77DRAFT_1075403 [Trametes polyzona]|nr:hypothetical protein C8Q77DRAFT_1075403 [Trametes polyzona]
MCFFMHTYTDYGCGKRRSTGRHRVACNKMNCRLSYSHRTDVHDCERECEGPTREDQHLVMEHLNDLCDACRNAGRLEHPQRTNGIDPNINYGHLVTPAQLAAAQANGVNGTH